MKGNMEERAVRLAQYIIENRATVRAAAAKFGVSKSTVHKDLSERLPTFNRPLYLQAKAVLEENKAERHIRGGIATPSEIQRQITAAQKKIQRQGCGPVAVSFLFFSTPHPFRPSERPRSLLNRPKLCGQHKKASM